MIIYKIIQKKEKKERKKEKKRKERSLLEEEIMQCTPGLFYCASTIHRRQAFRKPS